MSQNLTASSHLVQIIGITEINNHTLFGEFFWLSLGGGLLAAFEGEVTLEHSPVWPLRWMRDGTVRMLVIQNVCAAQTGLPRRWDGAPAPLGQLCWEWDPG